MSIYLGWCVLGWDAHRSQAHLDVDRNTGPGPARGALLETDSLGRFGPKILDLTWAREGWKQLTLQAIFELSFSAIACVSSSVE